MVAQLDDVPPGVIGMRMSGTAGSVGLKHRKAWERFALVTEKDWMRTAVAAFGRLSPGELRVFDPAQLEEANAWVTATG